MWHIVLDILILLRVNLSSGLLSNYAIDLIPREVLLDESKHVKVD